MGDLQSYASRHARLAVTARRILANISNLKAMTDHEVMLASQGDRCNNDPAYRQLCAAVSESEHGGYQPNLRVKDHLESLRRQIERRTMKDEKEYCFIGSTWLIFLLPHYKKMVDPDLDRSLDACVA